MKLRNLLTIASIPFLLTTRLNADSRNYGLRPDPASNDTISYPYNTKSIEKIYKANYLILPLNDYSDSSEVCVGSVKNNIKGEVLLPILNNTFGEDTLNEKRRALEDTLKNIITTDATLLEYFDICFSDNRLEPAEFSTLHSLLKGKTAIAYFIKEEVQTDNSYRGKIAYNWSPQILILNSDSSYAKKDSIPTETKKDSTEFKQPVPKKKTWRDFIKKK